MATDPPSLRIQEMFVSIQGEGGLAGTASSFIRVSGCNLRCVWCDSPRTSWAPEGDRIHLDALVAFCREGPRHVVITGGEPLVFPEVVPLAATLTAAGHHVTFETAGTTWREELQCDLLSLSPKLAHSTPSSRLHIWADRHERRRWQPDVLTRLMKHPWQLKFVVRARNPELLEEDLFEVESMLDDVGVSGRDRERVFLMPECTDPGKLGRDYAALSAACRRTGFRLGPRLHLTAFGHTPGT